MVSDFSPSAPEAPLLLSSVSFITFDNLKSKIQNLKCYYLYLTATMTSDNFTQVLQKSFRITLGATAALVENLQDPHKRTEKFSELSTELQQLTTEWAAKGEITEQEARNFVQQLWNRLGNKPPSPTTDTATPSTTTPVENVAPPDVQLELQELTAQLAAIRAELEKLQNPDSDTP